MTKKLQLITVVSAFTLLTFSSCKKEIQNIGSDEVTTTTPDFSEKGANPDEANISGGRHSSTGYLYTEGNEAGTNQIHIYKQHGDGHLTSEGMVASGGAGNAAGLGSQGALALSKDSRWLFAVNAGDNSVSSFRVHEDGSLTLRDTRGSGGITPVSLCYYNGLLYVVHAGNSRINGFKVGPGGNITHIQGSNRALSNSNAGPAQIAFSPNGDYLYVTEKMTNKITKFDVESDGSVSNRTSMSSVGNTPFGFYFARDEHYMIVSNANGGTPNGSSSTSYGGVNAGNLNAVNGAVANNQTAACWVATTKYGRFAYVTNTGSDNISSYYVAPWGGLYLVHSSTVTTGSHPIDICVASNNYYVYNINSLSQSIGGYRRALLGELVSNGEITGIPEFATGLVAW